MSPYKFLISISSELMNDEEIVTKRYLNIETDVTDFMDAHNGEDRKIIALKFSVDDETYVNDEMVSCGSRFKSFALDIPLKDEDYIYGLANGLNASLLNTFSHLFKERIIKPCPHMEIVSDK